MQTYRIGFDVLEPFCVSLFEAAGLAPDRAQTTAHAICTASLQGTDSHGIRLVPHYLKCLGTGRIVPDAAFVFTRTGAATATLDAQHGMAHAAIAHAMDNAITMAQQNGAGFVSIANSNHCGAMAPFALRACEHDMIGFAFTNATAKLQTFSAKKPFFGINPLCMAAPMADETPFCFDAAPTVMSNNKVKMMAAANQELPAQVAADADGTMTLDPNLAKMLIPLGADLAGYKGFGWAMMIDILCSLLSGMPNGRDVTSMYESDGGKLDDKRYLGQFVGALRIDSFIDSATFKRRLQDTANAIRKQAQADQAVNDVMVPGDPEKKTAARRLKTGIPVPDDLLQQLNDYATAHGLNSLEPKEAA